MSHMDVASILRCQSNSTLIETLIHISKVEKQLDGYAIFITMWTANATLPDHIINKNLENSKRSLPHIH